MKNFNGQFSTATHKVGDLHPHFESYKDTGDQGSDQAISAHQLSSAMRRMPSKFESLSFNAEYQSNGGGLHASRYSQLLLPEYEVPGSSIVTKEDSNNSRSSSLKKGLVRLDTGPQVVSFAPSSGQEERQRHPSAATEERAASAAQNQYRISSHQFKFIKHPQPAPILKQTTTQSSHQGQFSRESLETFERSYGGGENPHLMSTIRTATANASQQAPADPRKNLKFIRKNSLKKTGGAPETKHSPRRSVQFSEATGGDSSSPSLALRQKNLQALAANEEIGGSRAPTTERIKSELQ